MVAVVTAVVVMVVVIVEPAVVVMVVDCSPELGCDGRGDCMQTIDICEIASLGLPIAIALRTAKADATICAGMSDITCSSTKVRVLTIVLKSLPGWTIGPFVYCGSAPPFFW